jgi:membrane-bound lytic murein transglycosylase A
MVRTPSIQRSAKPNSGAALAPLSFGDLAGFDRDDCLAAFAAWRRSASALVSGPQPTRPGVAAPQALLEVARAALNHDVKGKEAARDFFVSHFCPYRVVGDGESRHGFVTGYYEPIVRGALAPSAAFNAPVLGRPADLVSFAPGETPAGLDQRLSSARRSADGRLGPYPDRATIEAAAGRGELTPILWLEDHVELFLAQVQGSARVALPDGRQVRLAYDGRNGQPYTSIGRLLIEAGEIRAKNMSLAALKSWLRANGQDPGQKGRNLMQRNLSYVFFKIEENFSPEEGPTGGAGVPLKALRSIAIDRGVWPYGAPFWIEARLPWRDATPRPFHRLMIAQDTGSAIVGAARADIFFGAGEEAGRRAGDIRHEADFAVLLPRGSGP